MRTRSPLLSVERLCSGYGRGDVLKGISLEVFQGEVRTILGANGAGKTTLLRTIVGLIAPSSGTVRYSASSDDRAISGWPAHRASQLGIVLVPEGRGILGQLTVEDNLKMGAFHVADAREVARRVDGAYERFPVLSSRRGQLAATLSGGEQQMLALARGLVAAPQLLLLDEPSLGLAPQIVRTVFDIISEIHASGTSVLLVEQNVNYGLAIADWAYVLSNGRLTVDGPPKVLAADNDVRRAYLGL